MICLCASGSRYIAHLNSKKNENVISIFASSNVEIEYSGAQDSYMTWLSIISSKPSTGDLNIGGQSSPEHGER